MKNISTSSNICKCIMLYNALYFAVYSHIFLFRKGTPEEQERLSSYFNQVFCPIQLNLKCYFLKIDLKSYHHIPRVANGVFVLIGTDSQ